MLNRQDIKTKRVKLRAWPAPVVKGRHTVPVAVRLADIGGARLATAGEPDCYRGQAVQQVVRSDR
jgi:hypothetical protein